MAATSPPIAPGGGLASARGCLRNPTGDFNWLPLISLIKGPPGTGGGPRGARDDGFDARLEDLWKPYFCVPTKILARLRARVRPRPLQPAVLASTAIPAPAADDLRRRPAVRRWHVNNFPVDVMRGVRARPGHRRCLRRDRMRRIPHAEVPGAWSLLRDRLRPRAARRWRLPSLAAYLMNVTVLFSTSRQRASRRLTDVYLNPPLARVGMLEWKRFDEIVEQGYRHACEVLDSTAAAPAEAPIAAVTAVAEVAP